MFKNTLTTIKLLSDSDQKNLCQRGLKLTEEVGELAKAILPYENSFATTHRFVTKNNILEEVADTLLCAFDVAYKAGISDEEIRDMMDLKSIKWNKLQQASLNGQFPLPFEIHITVTTQKYKIKRFKQTCADIGVKPIILDLGQDILDVMTSSVIMTDNLGAYNEMNRIASYLTDSGFVVIREKIETVPWHPSVPIDMEDVNNTQYFESHVNIMLNEQELVQLKECCTRHLPDLHFSKNVYKRINEDDFIQMVTVRSSTITSGKQVHTVTSFTNYVNDIIKSLLWYDILREGAILKHVIEFAIYDTNINHDTKWIEKI
ncbi:MAG: hypothetical protein ACXW2E_01760 [Nitrososphaeraceae archaeon]